MNVLISWLRSRPVIAVVGITLLLLAGVLGVTAWMTSGNGNAGSSNASARPALDTYQVVNTAGRYHLEVPKG